MRGPTIRVGPQNKITDLVRSSLFGGFKYKIHREGHKHTSYAEVELDTEEK